MCSYNTYSKLYHGLLVEIPKSIEESCMKHYTAALLVSEQGNCLKTE